MEGLHPLLPEEAPEDLEAAELEELLLGVGEVSQHGGQREERLVGRELHQHRAHSRRVWHSLSPWRATDRRNSLQLTCVELPSRCIETAPC